MAHMYNLPIYMVNVNSELINDESIVNILNSISGSGNRIVLFEDIDSAFAEKEELKFQTKSEIVDKGKDKGQEVNKKYLTYSGLLNALDGVLTSHHGTIIIMTTNYIEKLGNALIRPGRIDFLLELTYCDYDQIVNMTTNIITKSYDLVNNTTLSFTNPYTIEEFDIKVQQFATNVMHNKVLSTVKPCELQVYILKYLENVDYVFDNYKELL